MKTPCARCGAPLKPDETQALCAGCLLVGGRVDEAPRASFEAPSVAELGQRFPHLEVIELIGQGGMGAVYRARQPRLDRLVALKVLRPEAARDTAFTDRFLQEARVLAKLSHPNIVGVHDFGVDGDLHWLMMEYVDGSNLRDVLAAGVLPPEDAFRLVPDICGALQYAHDHGVVHRDIKPENLLLDVHGRIRIADFGLARLADADSDAIRLTHTNEVFGTPRYMAPEQLTGARDVDHRADIYALGAVFYELLTGELPLGRFDPPSLCVQSLDARIDAVVMRALEKDPARRYQHASEVQSAVGDLGARISGRGREPLSAAGGVGASGPATADSPGREAPVHEQVLWFALCFACLAIGGVITSITDNPFPLMLLLFLPGCGIGAVMATPKVSPPHLAAALFLLIMSVALTVLGVAIQENAIPLLALLSLVAGIGAGYSEERKKFETA